MQIIVLYLLFAGVTAFQPFDPQLDMFWKDFKVAFKKNYDEREELARRLIWEQRIHYIVNHNLRADTGVYNFTVGVNEYSDLNPNEFLKRFNGFKFSVPRNRNGSTWIESQNIQLPGKVDWRKKGLVTPVKNQLQCGSWWVFSATGSLEGQNAKKTGQLVSLSEQNLIDCSRPLGNDGCTGGSVDNAFEYVKVNNGIDTEDSYPYKGEEQDYCYFDPFGVGARCTGFVDIPEGDEEALQKAVATVGPVSAAIDASHESFQLYRSGIYDESDCSSEFLNHGVLVVGYGTEDGVDYWLVKNSWGTTWGMKGYIKMSRNKGNQCGIATYASYPLV